MTKIKVRMCVDTVCIDGDTLAAVRCSLDSWIASYGEDAIINVYGNDVEIDINKYREETDEEYKARIARDALGKSALEQRERKQLKELKAKYGDA